MLTRTIKNKLDLNEFRQNKLPLLYGNLESLKTGSCEKLSRPILQVLCNTYGLAISGNRDIICKRLRKYLRGNRSTRSRTRSRSRSRSSERKHKEEKHSERKRSRSRSSKRKHKEEKHSERKRSRSRSSEKKRKEEKRKEVISKFKSLVRKSKKLKGPLPYYNLNPKKAASSEEKRKQAKLLAENISWRDIKKDQNSPYQKIYKNISNTELKRSNSPLSPHSSNEYRNYGKKRLLSNWFIKAKESDMKLLALAIINEMLRIRMPRQFIDASNYKPTKEVEKHIKNLVNMCEQFAKSLGPAKYTEYKNLKITDPNAVSDWCKAHILYEYRYSDTRLDKLCNKFMIFKYKKQSKIDPLNAAKESKQWYELMKKSNKKGLKPIDEFNYKLTKFRSCEQAASTYTE
jgi:hypothetical protein